MKLKIFTLIMILVTLFSAIPACANQEPGWEQVQSGILTVISNWHIGVLADGAADDFDCAAAAVAQNWAVDKYLNAVSSFVFKEVTKKAIGQIIDSVFPVSWATEVVRGNIVDWIYSCITNFLGNQGQFRYSNLSLSVNNLGKDRAALSGNLPSNMTFTDSFIVGYDRQNRRVSILVIADHNAEKSLFGGHQPRAWEAKYDIDDKGQPVNPSQSLQSVNLSKTQSPSDKPITKPTPTSPPPVTEPTPLPKPTQINKIAFVSTRDGNEEIYTMNSDGSNQTRITNNTWQDGLPCWSPDGKKIAFTSKRDNASYSDIYIMEADGSNIKRITDSKRHYIDPQWSPDGSKILFWSQHNNVTKSDIGFINMSDRRIVELMYTENNDLFATWSPDGQKIVFISDRDDTDGSNDIYIMNIDGTNQVKLINGVKAFYPPRFSPDGSKIAFCSVAGYDQYKIFLSDANGTNIRQITPSNKFSDVLFDWSLEGNQIIFSAVTRRSNLADLTDIYLINVDGTNLTRLTSGSGQDLAPSWLKTGLNRTPTSVSKQTPAAIPASVPPTCIPLLISPMAGAILDNGRVDSNDYIRWDFKWTDCPGSTAYHLYVIGPNAQNPVIDNSSIITSYYPYGSRGYVVERYRFGWTWKVRAKLNGQWSNWSETRSFDVGPLRNTPP